MNELKLLSVTGNLGYGFNESSLKEGKRRQPDMIGADNGSTDPGPYYLGSGEQLTREGQVKRDLKYSLGAARELGVPYVIGSAGTAGGKAHVNAFLKILYEIVEEENKIITLIRGETKHSIAPLRWWRPGRYLCRRGRRA